MSNTHSVLKLKKIVCHNNVCRNFVFDEISSMTFPPKLHFFQILLRHNVAMTEEEIQAKKDAHKDHIAAVEKFSKSLPFCWGSSSIHIQSQKKRLFMPNYIPFSQ